MRNNYYVFCIIRIANAKHRKSALDADDDGGGGGDGGDAVAIAVAVANASIYVVYTVHRTYS